ncbi:hypothetical protein KC976_01165 [Candidatus Saccharibacteria bacterium]|nr:hypothetical protein [Candidatus Saccharibacteria bacterium]
MSAAPLEVLTPLPIREAAPDDRLMPYTRHLAAMAVNGLLEAGLEVADRLSRLLHFNQEDIRRRPDQDPIDW